MAKDMVKELLGGKDLGSSNGAPYYSQDSIGGLLLILAGQETCKAASSAHLQGVKEILNTECVDMNAACQLLQKLLLSRQHEHMIFIMLDLWCSWTQSDCGLQCTSE